MLLWHFYSSTILTNIAWFPNKYTISTTLFLLFSTLMIIIINLSWAANQHSRMISEWSCDTEQTHSVRLLHTHGYSTTFIYETLSVYELIISKFLLFQQLLKIVFRNYVSYLIYCVDLLFRFLSLNLEKLYFYRKTWMPTMNYLIMNHTYGFVLSALSQWNRSVRLRGRRNRTWKLSI